MFVLATFLIAVTKWLKEFSIYFGSQFEGTVHAWNSEHQEATHILSAVSRQKANKVFYYYTPFKEILPSKASSSFKDITSTNIWGPSVQNHKLMEYILHPNHTVWGGLLIGLTYRSNFVLLSVGFFFILFSLFLVSLSLKSGPFHWLLTVWSLYHKKTPIIG